MGRHKVLPGLTAGQIFKVSELIGRGVSRLRFGNEPAEVAAEPELPSERRVA